MKGIQGPGASNISQSQRVYGNTPPVEEGKPVAAEEQSAVRSGDKIEISAEARKLAEQNTNGEDARYAKIEAARAKLESGELYDPKALLKAAENLLQSGQMDEA